MMLYDDQIDDQIVRYLPGGAKSFETKYFTPRTDDVCDLFPLDLDLLGQIPVDSGTSCCRAGAV